MKKLIQHLRKQSEETRTHILHGTVFIMGVILLLLWVYSLGANLSNPDTQTRMKQDLQPFSALKDNMVEGYNSISNGGNTTTTQ